MDRPAAEIAVIGKIPRGAGDTLSARTRLVPRPALFALLSAAAEGGVTLVSAPPGSGKTVLICSWIDHTRLSDRAAWVSIERGERDAQRFWLSVIDSLRTIEGVVSVVQGIAQTPDFDQAAVVERLELARWIGLAYVEVGCLSHLAVTDAWRSFALVRQRCAQALALAEAHGLSSDPVVCVAMAMTGLMDVAQAQFEAGQAWLDRADAVLRPHLENHACISRFNRGR